MFVAPIVQALLPFATEATKGLTPKNKFKSTFSATSASRGIARG